MSINVLELVLLTGVGDDTPLQAEPLGRLANRQILGCKEIDNPLVRGTDLLLSRTRFPIPLVNIDVLELVLVTCVAD